MKSSKFEQDKRLYAALLIGGVLIMLATLYFGAINSKAEARKAAEKDIADLKKQCNYYDDFLSADEVKSLSRLAEQIENIADVLDIMSESERSRFLRRYIGNDRVSCILILDEDLKPDSDYPEVTACYNEWSAEVSESAIADIIRYPRKIYSARIKHDSRTYDIAATARKDKTGVVFSAVLQNDEDLEQSYDSVRSLLGANETVLGGLLYITKDNELVGSNTDNKSVDKHEVDELNAYIAQKTDGDLTRFRCNGKIYYGAGAKYREYEVFVFYPSVEVYSGCRIALLVAFTLCIITSFLIITAYYHSRISHNREIERKNDIITTISCIYLLTVAIDLRKGTYTLLKYPREWGNVAAQGSADAAFYESLVNSAAAEFREGYRRFSDPGTLDERIREGGYLEYDYQNIRGEWQSDRIIPQDIYENGNLASFILVSKSTNEQKKAELKNQEKLKAAMKAEQTANQSKTDLLRRISHDTRTPINVILGMIEIASRNPDDAELQRSCRDKCREATEYLLDLVNDILTVNKIIDEAGEGNDSTVFDPAKEAEKVIRVADERAKAAGVTLTAEYPDCTGKPLVGEPLYLRQIMMNIITNAIKYSNKGGTVNISVFEAPDPENKDRAEIRFICEDHGIGMSREFQEKMFEPFSREGQAANGRFDGVGLGLAIVKKLVDGQNGTIDVQSEKGKGTRFEITLLYKYSSGELTEQKAETPPPAESLEGLNILVAEDNELSMEIVVYMLTDAGANVLGAANGAEALKAFTDSKPGAIDAILTDMTMPVTDGPELARRIRALDRTDAKTVPIIVMTANLFDEDIKKCTDSGMTGFLPKPLNPAQLVATIAGQCRRHK
ncbi:signal transduction histidine kinase [Ruminococcus sp. CAG:382]|nr:signal transduction histidine kinase [Ruminococcus sp. CAG:382]